MNDREGKKESTNYFSRSSESENRFCLPVLMVCRSLEQQVGGANKRKEVLGDLVARVQQ